MTYNIKVIKTNLTEKRRTEMSRTGWIFRSVSFMDDIAEKVTELERRNMQTKVYRVKTGVRGYYKNVIAYRPAREVRK